MKIQKSDIEKMEMVLIEGIKKSDIQLLDKLLHDDLLFIAPNGQTITKAMDLESHKSGEMVVDKLLPTLGDITIIGDTAVSTITYDTKGKLSEVSIAGIFKYIRVWKKFDDGLKVIAGSCMQVG